MKRKNHYVSSSYLSNWSDFNGDLHCYRLLVPHEKSSIWKLGPPSSEAFVRDFYTSMQSGSESDEMETWFDTEFENEGLQSISRAIENKRLNKNAWRALIRYVVMQDLRTPARLLEHLHLSHKMLPEIIDATLDKAKERLESGTLVSKFLEEESEAKFGRYPAKLVTAPHQNPEMVNLGLEVTPGRATWQISIRRHLDKFVPLAYRHKWTILRPFRGISWPTSDNPVIRLNYNDEEDYSFKGGWGNPGSEILMPLSPQHIIYTQIDRPVPLKGTRLDQWKTKIIKKRIVEHAYRKIYSNSNEQSIVNLRMRIVDRDRCQQEMVMWEKWHQQQSAVEKKYSK